MSLVNLLPSSCLVSLRPCPIAYQAVLQNIGGCFEVRSSVGTLPGSVVIMLTLRIHVLVMFVGCLST